MYTLRQEGPYRALGIAWHEPISIVVIVFQGGALLTTIQHMQYCTDATVITSGEWSENSCRELMEEVMTRYRERGPVESPRAWLFSCHVTPSREWAPAELRIAREAIEGAGLRMEEFKFIWTADETPGFSERSTMVVKLGKGWNSTPIIHFEDVIVV